MLWLIYGNFWKLDAWNLNSLNLIIGLLKAMPRWTAGTSCQHRQTAVHHINTMLIHGTDCIKNQIQVVEAASCDTMHWNMLSKYIYHKLIDRNCIFHVSNYLNCMVFFIANIIKICQNIAVLSKNLIFISIFTINLNQTNMNYFKSCMLNKTNQIYRTYTFTSLFRVYQ